MDPKVFFLTRSTGSMGDELQNRIQQEFLPVEIIACVSVSDLKQNLHMQLGHKRIVIIFAETFEILNELILIRELLYSTELVMIIPGNDKQTFKIGHSFRPRFLFTALEDLSIVGPIAKTMFHRYDKAVATDNGTYQAGTTIISWANR